MVGLPTGRLISGNAFFVLDLDERENVSGSASLIALEQKYGPLPKTLRVRTPSGGIHIYFRQPLCKLPNRAGEFADGVDVRGDGGFVVAPGSIRSDGKAYEWIDDDFYEIAEAPPWVLYHAIFSKNQRARLAARNVHCAEDLGAVPVHLWAAKAREICRVKSDKASDPSAMTDARKAAIVKYVKEGVARECLKISEAVEGTRDDTLQRSVMPCLSLLLGAEQEGVDISELESEVFDAIVAAADTLGGEFNEDAVQRKWDAQMEVCDPRDLSHVGLDAKERASAQEEFADLGGTSQQSGGKSETEKLVKSATEMTLEAILEAEKDPLVEGIFLRRGEQATLHAETTAGKTFLMIDLGFHLSLEHLTKWHNRDVARVPVLCVQLEDVPGFEKRVVAAKKEFGDPGDWFMRINVPVVLNSTEEGVKGVKTIIDAAAEQARRCGVPTGLIIIDTKVRAMAGDNEDKTQDASRYIEQRVGRIIRATGATVVTVAHPNRAGDERGSLAFRQADDVRLTVVRKAGKRTLVAEKVRNGEDGPVFDYRLKVHELGQNAKGKPITSCTIIKEDPSHVGSLEPKPKRSEVTLEAAFRQAQSDGKSVTDLLPGAQVPGLRVEASVIEANFKALYPAKTAEAKKKAWQRVCERLPSGFEMDALAVHIWQSDAAFGVAEDDE